jgi:beta-lactamase regulating signal transducer with metallopeptidase domain
VTELVRLVTNSALTISDSFALALTGKATLALLAALAVARLCVRSRAAVRHLVFAASFGILAVLPVVTAVVPAAVVEVPVAPSAASGITGPIAGPTSLDHAVATAHSGRTPATSAPMVSLRPALMFGWLIGLVVVSVPIVLGLFQLRRLCRHGRPWPHGQSVLDAIAASAGVRRRVVLLQHEAVPGPLTCGLFTPTILVPADAANWDACALHERSCMRSSTCAATTG